MSESGRGGGNVAVQSKDHRQLIEQLKQMNMYETGMSTQDMEDMLEVVKLSRVPDKAPRSDAPNINKAPEPLRQDTQASYSKVLNSKPQDRTSTSPDLSSNQSRQNSSNEKRRESSDDDSSSWTQINRKSMVKENRDNPSTNKTRSWHNETSTDAFANNRFMGQQLENYNSRNNDATKPKINPLDSSMNDNDRPLLSRCRQSSAKDSIDNNATFVNFDKAVARLTNHLQRIAENWQSQRIRNLTGSTVSWGKPIQIDTDDNDTTDDELTNDEKITKMSSDEKNSINENAMKKKRKCTKKIINYTNEKLSDDDYSDDEIFSTASTSKRRKSSKLDESTKNKIFSNLDEKNFVDEKNAKIRENAIDEIPEDEKPTNEDDKSMRKKKKDENKIIISDEEFDSNSQKNKNPTKIIPSSPKNSSPETKIPKIESKNSEIDEDDENHNDEDQKPVKKAKTTKSQKSSSMEKFSISKKSKKIGSRCNLNDEDCKPVCIEDSDEITTISDDEDADEEKKIRSTSKKMEIPQKSIFSNETLKKKFSNISESSTSSFYPRRVAPPIPKGKRSSMRSINPLFGYSRRQGQKNRCETMEKNSDDEDATILEVETLKNAMTLNKVTDKNVEKERSIDSDVDLATIKPLRLSDRMKLQLKNLKAMQDEEKRLETERERAKRLRDEEICRKRGERIKERLEEQKRATMEEERRARAKNAVEERWNALLNKRGRKNSNERTELNPEGPRRDNDFPTVVENSRERFRTELNDVRVANDGERSDVPNFKRVPCPICGKKFLPSAIEDHAGSCEDYDSIEIHTSGVTLRPTSSVQRSDSPKLFECEICNVFKSNDGVKYEDHVNKCVASRRDAVLVGPSTVVTLSNSPIREFRKISEQTDSEINYREQFVPKTKSRVNENRTRKRKRR